MKWRFKDYLRLALLLLSGWTTVFMQQFVPVAGGGMSLVFVISVPLQIGISLIFSTILFLMRRKTDEDFKLNLFSVIFLVISVGLALTQYPYR